VGFARSEAVADCSGVAELRRQPLGIRWHPAAACPCVPTACPKIAYRTVAHVPIWRSRRMHPSLARSSDLKSGRSSRCPRWAAFTPVTSGGRP